MYLFSKTRASKAGHEQDLIAWAASLRDIARSETGIEVAAYSRMFGDPVGGVTFYATFETFAALGEAASKLGESTKYQEAVRALASMSEGSSADHFLEIPVGPSVDFLEVLTVDTGLAKLARMDDAMGFAMKMASIISKQSQQHTVFAADMYGPLGAMAWITPAESFAQLDAQGAAIMGDEEYKKLMSESPTVFDAEKFDRFLDRAIR